MRNNIKKSLFLWMLSLSLKKKLLYRKEMFNMILKLKNLFVNKSAYNYKRLSLFLESSQKQSFSIMYIICFSFSSANTFLHVIDSLGNLKFQYSAGLMGFKGKQKQNRLKILHSFLKELRRLKISVLKNKPIALIFNHIDFYKYFLVKKLKKFFFIRLLKNYQIQAYNGCRKKKRLRKK
jgi:hypothetical protein